MSEEITFPHLVLARLYGYLEPMDRGERFEDPLQEVLDEHGVGEVTGGGTQLHETHGIEFAELEIYLANLDEAAELVRKTLEELGAPVGSVLRLGEDHPDAPQIHFGKYHEVAIYLDGVNLPQEIYDELDFGILMDDIETALDGERIGTCFGIWSGPTETAIYLYGPNADAIFKAVEPVTKIHRIFSGARVVCRREAPPSEPREFRLPAL